MHKITYDKQLYNTGNGTQHSVMTDTGKESKNEWVFVYVELIHFAVHWKPAKHCKPTTLQ